MPIDYARARRESPGLKSALTRAERSGDPQKVVAACRKAVVAWNAWGAWPDAWHRWENALRDARYADLRANGTTTIPSSLDDLG